MLLFKRIKQYRPKEVYCLAVVLFAMFFLNPTGHGDFFSIFYSPIYGIILGIGDGNLRDDAGHVLYWLCATAYAFVFIRYRYPISEWLWRS